MTNKELDIDKIVRLALIVLIVAWSFQLLYPLLGILAWSFILSVIVFPLYDWLNHRLGLKPALAASPENKPADATKQDNAGKSSKPAVIYPTISLTVEDQQRRSGGAHNNFYY